MTEFDLTKEYDNEIKPIIDELYKKCIELKMPMFVTCCVKNGDPYGKKPKEANISTYQSESFRTTSSNIKLYDDHINKHLAVLNGFKVVPDGIVPSFNEEDIEYMAGVK